MRMTNRHLLTCPLQGHYRHFFRHAYGYTLEWSQLRWKAESLSETLTMLREQLQVFFQAVTNDQGPTAGN
jgi:hypothetical protein